MVVYLVRSFRTYARIRSLTTGTFNRVVKDRIAFRLSGAPSVLGGSTQVRIRLSSKPFNHIVRAKPCQPAHPTAFTHVFRTWNLSRIWATGERLYALEQSSEQRATVWPSARDEPITDFSAHAEAEDRKLRKDPIGGPCFEGTLQKPTGVSESSPVAGTIENSTLSECLDAGRTREIQTNYDRLPHFCSRWIVYTR